MMLDHTSTRAAPGLTAAGADPVLEPTYDLTSFLAEYERKFPHEVVHIEQPIAAEYEITALVTKLEKAKRFPVVICHNVTVDGQRAEMPVVTFVLASRLRLARALGTDVPRAGLACYERVQAKQKPVVVARDTAPVKQVVETGPGLDVRRLPAPLHHSMDPGRYLTHGFFLTYNRYTHCDNSAMHRGWIAGRDEIRVWLQPSCHNMRNLRQFEEVGEDMPAAFWIGHHPLVLLGGVVHVGPDDSHYESAGGAVGAPLRLVPSETLGDDFLVPADAEVVVEGYVPAGQRKPEGPFGEYTRHQGPQRWGPFMKVTAITHRRNAYWDDVMVGHTHWLSSLAKEGEAYRAIRRAVPDVQAVHCPMSGNGNSHIYVQIKKTVEGQGRSAAIAALNAFYDIKHAFVFDDDVDIYDDREVFVAMAARFQGDRGLVVLPNVTGSSLDPSSPDGVTMTKVGFDCTKPAGKPFAARLSVPDEVMARIDPAAILGRQRLEAITIEPWG